VVSPNRCPVYDSLNSLVYCSQGTGGTSATLRFSSTWEICFIPTKVTAAPGVERTNWSDHCPSGLVHDHLSSLSLEQETVHTQGAARIREEEDDHSDEKGLAVCQSRTASRHARA